MIEVWLYGYARPEHPLKFHGLYSSWDQMFRALPENALTLFQWSINRTNDGRTQLHLR